MARLRSPYLWLALLAAVAVVAVTVAIGLLDRAAGLQRVVAALAVAALGALAAAGWLQAHRERTRSQHALRALDAARQAAGMVLRDPLTGLGNQRLFDTELRSAFARAQRYARPFSVLLIELGTSESRRDSERTSGYDRILKYVAGILQNGLRASDTVARVGDSMFGVVLCETDQEGALVAWERVRTTALAHWPEGRSWSLSGGTAMYTVDTASVESLLSDADRRLALEKRRLRTEPE